MKMQMQKYGISQKKKDTRHGEMQLSQIWQRAVRMHIYIYIEMYKYTYDLYEWIRVEEFVNMLECMREIKQRVN